ncbi:hypothetical protein Psed_5801 [Pseudonocardia dioxanivorans CB1190]|uniref:Uncharacterized protein n=1 Tax=Pseudonocardia dioxanivorans (strain ATCC 55486 / DSM 44775 / JCM 13855 / CB1190) TaxID=675635 RepID=F4D1E0_PSEUX|nr:hypothetical protein [Pseudonocardia dioxanivorans]AEA27928.1 hypothetical protein Psed_5801 [Pseudonocardia dioxanivorans CB1190]
MGYKHAELMAQADTRLGSGTPATWYLGMSLTVSNADGSGFTEPGSGVNYGRVAISNNTTNWPAAVLIANRVLKRNGAKFTFANPTGSWGLLVEWGLFLALTGGLPRITNPLNQPISPKSGNTPVEFDINALELPFGGS